MLFNSRLPCPSPASGDVFNYIFHYGRRAYPWQRIIYRVDGTNETLTLAELEEKSRCFADSLVRTYGIKPNDVVAILARDKVRHSDAPRDDLVLLLSIWLARRTRIRHQG